MALRARALSVSLLAALAAAPGNLAAAPQPLRALRSATAAQGTLAAELTKEVRALHQPCPGTLLFYRILLSNHSSPGTGERRAEIRDVIPPGTTLLPDTLTGATLVGGEIVWIGTLGPGDTHVITFTVVIDPIPPGSDLPPPTEIVNNARASLQGLEPIELAVSVPLEGSCPLSGQCHIRIEGPVEDTVGNRSSPYPVSNARVSLYDLGADRLPISPLSEEPRTPARTTRTNDTDERGFDGVEFPDPEEARYEFEITFAVAPEAGLICPPRVAVASFLWDFDHRFAVTSDQPIGGRFVPLYLARCLSPLAADLEPAGGPCLRWQPDGINSFVASPLAFTFGTSPSGADSAKVIGSPQRPELSEPWRTGSARADTFLGDGAHVHFFTYKAMEYLDGLGLRELAPAVVAVHSEEEDRSWTGDQPPAGFGSLGEPDPPPNPDAIVHIHDQPTMRASGSATDDGHKPDNREWHEMGHYWMIELYSGAWPGGARPPVEGGCEGREKLIAREAGPMPPLRSFEHTEPFAADRRYCGYLNPTTTESWIEGFAIFTSMVTAEFYGDPRPHHYRWGGSNSNLNIDYRMWGSEFASTPSGELEGISTRATFEDFAVAGILWDLHDGGNLQLTAVREQKIPGVISKSISTEDAVSLSDRDLFGLVAGHTAGLVTVEDLHDVFLGAVGANTDPAGAPDGVPDVSEIFIAHGAFDDVAARNLLHDPGEEPGLSGSSRLPERPGRAGKALLPNAFLRASFVDGGGAPVDPSEVVIEIGIRVLPPFGHYSHAYRLEPGAERIYLPMPPHYFPSQAAIRAVWPAGGKVSTRFRLDSETFWQRVDQEAEFVAEPTFVLDQEPGCVPGATTLCLSQDRFQVEVEWATAQGTSGQGQALSLTGDTGYFWFFDPANVELVVKVLDACSFTDRFWVFAGGLTDVEADITVTDTVSGESKTYHNPQRTPFQPIQDTDAFATCPGSAGRAAPDPSSLEALLASAAEVLAPVRNLTAGVLAGGVDPPSTELSLGGDRFQVEVEWATFQGTSGQGQSVPLTADTGYFWFFDPANVELVIKVLDACSFTGRFWVFAGGLTDVEVVITVTDTEGGESKTYRNSQRTPFQPIQDTSAFATCP